MAGEVEEQSTLLRSGTLTWGEGERVILLVSRLIMIIIHKDDVRDKSYKNNEKINYT